MTSDTIFALSSGQVPAGIAVIRISGPDAARAVEEMAGPLPSPRRAALRTLRVPRETVVLDEALVLWFPSPRSVTGEDMAEFHCHGGRAVVAAVSAALAGLGLRPAQAGEFTRRAFAHGRIDLAEAEGLGDLLAAETELQRRSALAMAGGALSRQVEHWRMAVLGLSAQVEAQLDFSDEDDVDSSGSLMLAEGGRHLAEDLDRWLARPRAEPLRDGFRVVLAGPPNAGKSTLFNALVGTEAAIVSAEAGTTRDLVERPVALEGVPFTFVDTAGLREDGVGEIEMIGIERARAAAARADLVLWLGPEGEGPQDGVVWEVAAQSDRPGWLSKRGDHIAVSARSGEGLNCLRERLVTHARGALPKPGEVALNARQHGLMTEVRDGLAMAAAERDLLLMAEGLRLARLGLDRLVGRTGTEDMLDALFGRFCIGK